MFGSKKLVLIVEDTESHAQLMAAYVKYAGARSVTAGNFSGALAAVQKQNPALVITDIMIPGGTGLDLAMSLRKHPKLGLIPIIVVSAHFPEAEILKLEQTVKNCRVFQKPLKAMEVTETIKRMLSSGKA